MKQQVANAYREAATASAEHWWFTGRRAILARVLREHVPRTEPARVLDLGPGYGIHADLLGAWGPLTAIDTDVASLRATRERGATPLLADAAAPPLRDGTFDLVCALDVLEHLDDDARALAEYRRILAGAGRLLLTVPAVPLLWGRQDVAAEHKRRYTIGRLRRLLDDADLVAERLTYFNTLLFPPTLAVRLAMRPFLRWTSGSTDFDLPTPRILDKFLARLFAAEARILAHRDLPIGVSLLALARPRTR